MKNKLLYLNLYTLGALCIMYSIVAVLLRLSPYRLSFVGYAQAQTTVDPAIASDVAVESKPIRVTVERVDIDVLVTESRSVGNTEISSSTAMYAGHTPTPGHTGNSIIFGHNWSGIFGNLLKVVPGDIIVVSLSNGTSERFQVQAVDTVSKYSVEVLHNTPDRRLTLYTCTGLFDEKRFVVSAVRM